MKIVDNFSRSFNSRQTEPLSLAQIDSSPNAQYEARQRVSDKHCQRERNLNPSTNKFLDLSHLRRNLDLSANIPPFTHQTKT